MKNPKCPRPQRLKAVARGQRLKAVARWLSISELANELGVSRKTLYRWVEAGCPHEGGGLGRPYRFDREAVIEWMEQTGSTGAMGRPPEGSKPDPKIEEMAREAATADAAGLATLTRRVNLAIKLQELRKRERLERLATGELHDRGECERGRLERIAVVKAGLLALPGKLAARLENREAAEIQRELDREVRHLLAQFAGQA